MVGKILPPWSEGLVGSILPPWSEALVGRILPPWSEALVGRILSPWSEALVGRILPPWSEDLVGRILPRHHHQGRVLHRLKIALAFSGDLPELIGTGSPRVGCTSCSGANRGECLISTSSSLHMLLLPAEYHFKKKKPRSSRNSPHLLRGPP